MAILDACSMESLEIWRFVRPRVTLPIFQAFANSYHKTVPSSIFVACQFLAAVAEALLSYYLGYDANVGRFLGESIEVL